MALSKVGTSDTNKTEMEDNLWSMIEKELHFIVPVHMRLALSYKNFGNPLELSKLTEFEVRDENAGILHFIRHELPEIIEEKYYSDVFGKYANSPQQFQLEEADVDSIVAIAEWISEKLKFDNCFFSNFLKRPAELEIPELSEIQDTRSPKIRRREDPLLIRETNSTSGTTFHESGSNQRSGIFRMSGIVGIPGSESFEEVKQIEYNGSTFLDMLLRMHEKKRTKSDRTVCYSDPLKDVAAFLYISGGRSLYNFLEHNLPLPSCSSVLRYIHSTDTIIEGQLRVQELKTFLTEHNLPLKVWLSDDATGIINRIRYHRKTNQIVGFVLPFDVNGMPKSRSFLATSAKRIEDMFKNETPARLLYTVIAQPLAENAPFFCLLMHGTNDRYGYEIVQKRWKHMIQLLQQEGIEVVGQSTDGDSRAFKVMRLESGMLYGNTASTCNMPEFKAKLRPETVYMQDTVHIVARLKSRLLKNCIILAIGNYIANISHLKMILKTAPKDEHALTLKDLYSVDKMNFDSVLRISHPRVIKCLEQYIPNSEGTQQYLKIIHMILNSVLDVQLSIENRIYYIWYCVFFLRLWRAWLLQHEQYSTENNFITLNSYICTEINAHALLNMVLYHIDKNSFSDFLPYMYGSQPCESFFRLLRSIATVFCTMVNCDLLDAMCRIKKIERLCQTVNKTYNEDSIVYPRQSQFRSSFDRLDKKKHSSNVSCSPDNLPKLGSKFDLPETKAEAEAALQLILEIAKSNAWEDAKRFGMNIDIAEANNIQVKVANQMSDDSSDTYQDKCAESDIDDVNDKNEDENESVNRCTDTMIRTETISDVEKESDAEESEDADDDDDDEDDCEDGKCEFYCNCNHDNEDGVGDSYYELNAAEEKLDLDSLKSDFNLLQVPDKFLKNSSKICENCPYTYVINKSGNRVLIWKSSLVWLLSKEIGRVSSDRLARVQVPRSEKEKSRQKYSLRGQNDIANVQKLNTMYIGDWCLFKNQEDENDFVVGFVLHFAKNFGDETKKITWKSIEYKQNSVDLSIETSSMGVLCQWYKVNFNTNCLEYLSVVTHGYTEISNYMAHIPQPMLQNLKTDACSQKNNLILKKDIGRKIKEQLRKTTKLNNN